MKSWFRFCLLVIVIVALGGCAPNVPPPNDVVQARADIKSAEDNLQKLDSDISTLKNQQDDLKSKIKQEEDRIAELEANRVTPEELERTKVEAVKRMRGSGRSESEISAKLQEIGFDSQEIRRLLDATR